MAQKGLWNLATMMLEDGGELSKAEANLDREYKATHEENFLGSWLKGRKMVRWRRRR